jgi:hypothetical protein
MASERSLEMTSEIMVRSFMRLRFACVLSAPARAFAILNGSVEDRSGIKARRNGSRGSAGITVWIVP